jgi:hypothetical protein
MSEAWIPVAVESIGGNGKINAPPMFDNQIQQIFPQSALNFSPNRRRITSRNHEQPK